jgi:hypothetical protein
MLFMGETRSHAGAELKLLPETIADGSGNGGLVRNVGGFPPPRKVQQSPSVEQ